MSTQLCEDIQPLGMQRNQQETSWKHLNEQRRDGQLCDITFNCDGGDVLAHKCVLASLSGYFKVLFTSPLSAASTTNVVSFNDFSVDVVTLLMDLVYSQVGVPAVHVVELLRLADYVQLQWLVDMLVENIRNRINETNVFEWYAAAKELGLGKLKFLCECYVRENAELLHLEDVQRCFDSNILNKIQMWDNDLSREVVIINTSNGYFLIDPKMGSIVDLIDDCGAGSMIVPEPTKFWAGKGVLVTAFVHQNVMYLVTSHYDTVDKEVYSIWKFQHASRNLGLVCALRRSELRAKLIENDVKILSFTQLLYDGKDSLYVLCSLKWPTCYGECVFKLSVGSWLFYEGYVVLPHEMHLAYIKGHQTCLVTPDYVLNLEEHNFEVPGFHSDALLKTEINQQLINTSKNTELPNSPANDLYWEVWHPVNKDGQFYCLVDDTTSDLNFILTLRLDMDKHSWVVCDCREFIYDGEGDFPRCKLFHCDNTLYQHWMDADGTSQETSYLDEEKSTFKRVDFSPVTAYADITSFVVIPYHILL